MKKKKKTAGIALGIPKSGLYSPRKIGAIPPTGHLDEENRSTAVNSTRWQTVRQRGGWEFYKSLLFVTTVLFTGMAAASCSQKTLHVGSGQVLTDGPSKAFSASFSRT